MKVKHEVSQYLTEFIGTFFLVFFGCGAIVLAESGQSQVGAFIPLIFGGAVAAMIFATGHISGAHFNPAVTLSFWLTKRFPAKRIPGYICSQILGAIAASLIHWVIWGADHSFGATSISTSMNAGFVMEIILSFVLMFVIISVATDSRAVGELSGIAIGTTVSLCAFVGGPLTTASMNPARTLGPALVSGNLNNLWLYIVAPCAGAALGAITYEWIRCNKEGSVEKHGCC